MVNLKAKVREQEEQLNLAGLEQARMKKELDGFKEAEKLELDRVKADLDRVSQELLEKTELVEDMSKELETYFSQCEEKQGKIDLLEKDLETLRKEAVQREDKLRKEAVEREEKSLAEEKSRSQAIGELKTIVIKMQADAARTDQEKKKLVTENSSLREKISSVEETRDEEKRFEGARLGLKTELKELEKMLNQKIEEMERENSELVGTINRTKTDLEQASERLKEKDKEVKILTKDKDVLSAKLEELETRLKVQCDKVLRLQEFTHEANTNLSSSKADLVRVQAEKQDLETRVAEEKEKLRAELTEAEKKEADLKLEIAELKTTIISLEANFAVSETVKAELKSRLEETIKTTEAEKEAERDKATLYSVTIKTLQGRISELETQSGAQRGTKRTREEDLGEENNRLKREIKKLRLIKKNITKTKIS